MGREESEWPPDGSGNDWRSWLRSRPRASCKGFWRRKLHSVLAVGSRSGRPRWIGWRATGTGAVEVSEVAGCAGRGPDVVQPLPGQEPLAVPHPLIQVQHAQPRQVPGVRVHLAAQHVIAEPVHAGQGVSHADPVEELPVGR